MLAGAALRTLIGMFPVPPFLLPIYQTAGVDYAIPWEVLAAINEFETDYGRNLSISSAGAIGWMQFMPQTWARYGFDADGSGLANPYDPIDAIFAAARYLDAAGAERNLVNAIFAYNHAKWYVNSVLLRAKVLQLVPASLVDGLIGLMDGTYPVAGHLGPYATLAPAAVKIGGARAAQLSGPSGAPVIAVADARVVGIGVAPGGGAYVSLVDSYGDRFSYSELGSIESYYPVLSQRYESSRRLTGVPAPTATATGAGAHPTAPAGGQAPASKTSTSPARATTPLWTAPTSGGLVKERLFAHPSRAVSYAAGGSQQLKLSVRSYAAATDTAIGGGGRDDYFSMPLRVRPGQFTLSPLRVGATVVAGTVLGHLAHSSAGAATMALQITPAGARAPVNPAPIVAGWRLLGRLTAGRHTLVGPSTTGAYGARNTTLGQLLLANRRTLRRAVLSDPRVSIYPCGRADVARGRVDWRVLAVIEYLSHIGLAPDVTGLVCGRPASSAAGLGTQVVISALGGTPVAGHQQAGGVVDRAIRAVLGLQGALRPSRIVSTRSYPWEPIAIALPDHTATLEIDFAAPGRRRSALLLGELDSSQWTRLMARLTQLSVEPGQPAPAGARSRAAP
jgi:hypothetical protein